MNWKKIEQKIISDPAVVAWFGPISAGQFSGIEDIKEAIMDMGQPMFSDSSANAREIRKAALEALLSIIY